MYIEREIYIHKGATYCTPEINTSEITVDCHWHFPTDFQWHFPAEFHCSFACVRRIVTFPVDFLRHCPMDFQWRFPMEFHFCYFWCAIVCPELSGGTPIR